MIRFKPLSLLLALAWVSPDLVVFGGTQTAQKELFGESEKIVWLKDGEKKSLTLTDIQLHDYLSIEQLARLSQSQIRWQSVTQQVCLSRYEQLMCFNWDRSLVYLDGQPVSKKSKLKLIKNKLYVPFKFVTSKSFQKFSRSEIKWNSKKEQLVQNSPVNLSIPAVENLGDRYRLKIDAAKENSFKLLEQSNRRVWIRFPRGRSEGSAILEGDDVIHEVRVVQKRKSADLILKIGKSGSSSEVYYDPGSKKLVIDVFYSDSPRSHQFANGKRIPVPVYSRRPRRKYKPSDDRTIRTIVIDAGHGGHDTGAVGTRGTYEKTINLKLAKKLAQRLKKRKGIRVIMTREKDELIPLAERTRIANEAKADLFVSIHCNSSLSAKSKGFEVYLLAPEATDEAAAAVARMENSVVALETNNKKLGNKVNQLLASMAINNFVNESSECSAYICRGVKKASTVKNTAVREGNFHVLRGAQMPAVLIELEYLSNPISELKLRSSRYRSLLAKGIEAGIMKFDKEQRNKGILASRSGTKR